VISRLLANATLYEFVQTVTGSQISEAKIRHILGRGGPIEPGARILDAGGGTGIMARIFDAGRNFCCMDLDLARLRVARARGASVVQGDVTRMPVRSASIDLVVLRAISHHLGDDGFAKMVAESRRVMKPGGRLLFLDAVWAPAWLPGRLLWRLDQGSHPRTEDHMRAVLENHFELERREAYSIYHRYFLAMARPKSEPIANG
jgi:ubiquinone/menaquinone biosynthesis C-methylase UbiE